MQVERIDNPLYALGFLWGSGLAPRERDTDARGLARIFVFCGAD
jgi:hypothetical protein